MANLIYYRNSATEEWKSIPALKGDKGDKGEPGTPADLSNYYTKSETNEAINTALGVIENGTY